MKSTEAAIRTKIKHLLRRHRCSRADLDAASFARPAPVAVIAEDAAATTHTAETPPASRLSSTT